MLFDPRCSLSEMALPPGPRAPAIVNMARLVRRPLAVLGEWHARYGDVFTVKFSGFGTGVYVVDPDAIRELLTGDQSDLRAGEDWLFGRGNPPPPPSEQNGQSDSNDDSN